MIPLSVLDLSPVAANASGVRAAQFARPGASRQRSYELLRQAFGLVAPI
jgi:hypothetical protein